jgi:hypothetical protein
MKHVHCQASSSYEWAQDIVERKGLPGIMLSLTNHLSFEAQRIAATALMVLIQRVPEAEQQCRNLMGPTLYTAFIDAPHLIHRTLDDAKANDLRIALLPYFKFVYAFIYFCLQFDQCKSLVFQQPGVCHGQGRSSGC